MRKITDNIDEMPQFDDAAERSDMSIRLTMIG